MYPSNNPMFEQGLAYRKGCVVKANFKANDGDASDLNKLATRTRRTTGSVALGNTLNFECPGCGVNCSRTAVAAGVIGLAKIDGECGILKATLHGEV